MKKGKIPKEVKKILKIAKKVNKIPYIPGRNVDITRIFEQAVDVYKEKLRYKLYKETH